jgi:hypothetical protein
LPIITELAPTAMALVMSPENRAAVGYDQNVMRRGRPRAPITAVIIERRSGNDARRANRPGADAHLDGVNPPLEERLRGFRCRDVARNQIDARMLPANTCDHVQHAL